MKPSSTNPRLTVLVIAIGFGVIYFITKQEWSLWVAFVVGILGGLSAFLAKWIDFVWMKLAWVLSLFVPKIVLSIIFFLVLFPIALLSRLFGSKDPLNLKNGKSTLFKEVDKKFAPESFENPW